EVDVKTPIAAARVYAAGDVIVSIDGKDVFDNRRWDEPLMKEVANVLATPKSPGGVGRHVLGVRTRPNSPIKGVLAKLVIESERGEVKTILTHGTWQTSSAQQRGTWWTPGFDASRWSAATVVARLGDRP